MERKHERVSTDLRQLSLNRDCEVQAAKLDAQRWQDLFQMQQQSQVPLQTITTTVSPTQVEMAGSSHPSSLGPSTTYVPFQSTGHPLAPPPYPSSSSGGINALLGPIPVQLPQPAQQPLRRGVPPSSVSTP